MLNQRVRNFIIENIRTKGDRPIPYDRICDSCNLGLDDPDDPIEKVHLERVISEISQFEIRHNRPDIAAIVVPHAGETPFDTIEVNELVNFWSDDKNFSSFGRV